MGIGRGISHADVRARHPAQRARKELNIVNPALPEFLEHLSIRNMRVGGSRVGLDFTRRGERTFCNVVDIEGDKLLVNVAFKKR